MPPPEPELYAGVEDFAGLVVWADCPELRWKPKPGEIRAVARPFDKTCIHDFDLQISCPYCNAERDKRQNPEDIPYGPGRRERWWHRLSR